MITICIHSDQGQRGVNVDDFIVYQKQSFAYIINTIQWLINLHIISTL